MKKLSFLCVAALICSISFAKIWRVNNNPGVVANFTTAQAANDAPAVVDGDTIHIEPSVTSYGNLDPTKRLTWISTGAFLDVHPDKQFSQNPGKIEVITAFNAGSSNSVFHVYVNSYFYLNASNIRLDRCYIGGIVYINNFGYGVPSNNIVINCYSGGNLFIYAGGNHIATNNIFEGGLYISSTTSSAVITHNVFNATSVSSGDVNNSIVENNIFNKANSPINFINCNVGYNFSGAPNILPAGNNNQNNVDMSTVFVNNNGETDSAFVLKAGSPAIGAGSGTPAVNLGAFGGSSPFRLALQPAIPAIYKIQAPAAPAGNTLNVTFSTKSNN